MGQLGIESGFFVFTLMPSLYCRHRCPHCYLSLAQRKDPTVLSAGKVREACEKVDAYYRARGIARKTVVLYWYGGEPTQMGDAYFTECADAIDAVFSPDKGYDARHTVLTSLVGVDLDAWEPIFRRYGRGGFQTSYDGTMRGAGYVRAWERQVREAVARGLRVSTISVVNRAILADGPEAVLDRLSALGVAETSWLPFMLNAENADSGKYAEYAPSMSEWSDFMIALTSLWLERRRAGERVPEIGQMRFVLRQRSLPLYANVAGQTLFLMPDGAFSLPDYRDGWTEFMRPFGNILEQDFAAVLASPARRRYLRRQVMRNGNAECLACEHANHCVMEFWKENRPGDDCFGGRRYAEWLLARADEAEALIGADAAVLY